MTGCMAARGADTMFVGLGGHAYMDGANRRGYFLWRTP